MESDQRVVAVRVDPGPSDLAWYAADAGRHERRGIDELLAVIAEAQRNEDAIQHERFEACRDAVALLQTAMLCTVSHDMPVWTMAYHAKGRLEAEQATYLHGGRVEQSARKRG